ncbi:MAG: hypothetical protein IJZ08_09830 [Clostridia bacterium]|nr:hypothetical protein [Clostridia bacterium]
MNDKLFLKVLIAVLAVCLILTAVHFIYAADAYSRCSIIHFIGKELW